ncbi:peptidase M28-like protein [Winogradskyella wandonensis]|uniref:Peptidase M28-like protein n=1 Tax=Winogradskyella wandonensis TaxID=1442586 RepID=A0A4R1KSI9_9FLAO|nr:M20/M25/M40 family metallo-hydrolase [Winogradskyella wandonensis]TCK67994.1 peptidase M28-like protein [Winogradskyella wandonensis]
MVNFIRHFCLFISVLVISSCAQNQSLNKDVSASNITYDSKQLLKNIKTLSSDVYEGRGTGTEGAAKARAYIIEQFKSMDVEPFGTFEHKFSFSRRDKTIDAVNVLAKIKGKTYPEKYIVISAHYDHLGKRDGKIYNGADDDASGIAALFAFAEVLKKNPPRHTVILAAFDAEEMGLQGANYFVEKMKDANILANINMDMISRSSKNELYVVGSRYSDKLDSIIKAFKNPTDTKLLVGHDGTDGKMDWTYSSDHGPFHKASIPFLYFGNEDHAAYHKPTDDFKDITPEFYKNAVTIIIEVFRDLDASSL